MKLRSIFLCVLILGLACVILRYCFSITSSNNLSIENANLLFREANSLWEECLVEKNDVVYLPKEKWTKSILDLKPLNVMLSPDGVYIITNRIIAQQSGFFVLPTKSSYVPPIHGEQKFIVIVERVYCYSISG